MDAGLESILQPQSAPPPSMDEAPQQTEPMAPPPVAADPPKPEPVKIPLPELLEERGRRQAAEREAQLYRQQMQQFFESQRPQPQPIDPITDPVAAYQTLEQRQAAIAQAMNEQALHQRANMSQMLAERDHGPEVVQAAVQAAIQAGVNRQFMAKPDPYRALMDWHKSQQVAKEVGTDLTAYRERVRQELLAEMQRNAGKAAPQNLPPSLSTATNAASNSAPVVESPHDFFKSMFKR